MVTLPRFLKNHFQTTNQTLDGKGKLLIPGLVDAHIHLDKALLLKRYPAVAGTFNEAFAKNSPGKAGIYRSRYSN